MPGITTIYVCSNCDAQFPKWSGRCLECGAWGTFQSQTIDQKAVERKAIQVSPAEIIDLAKTESKELVRIKTNISEIDRVLGGGLVPGSLILLGGEPGIGKSTIVAQIASAISPTPSPRFAGEAGSPSPAHFHPAPCEERGKREGGAKETSSLKNKKDILTPLSHEERSGRGAGGEGAIYISGEESSNQIKDRFERIKCNLKNIKFINETNVEKILATLDQVKPSLVIIDSIQTANTSVLPSESGSINQIRACAVKFLEFAKENNTAIILTGHITKDGMIAGPKSLEHIVDTVIYLEAETTHNYRILRATKNRFGSINEIGIFEMTSSGFQEIKNPSAIFIEQGDQKITGAVISCIIEGTRPFLIEIQALVSKTVFGYPQRKAAGFDFNRLQILCAVLTKRTKINLTNQDVIVNIVGGLKINDPALDLAICYAIASSLLNQVVDRKTIVLGEVGLGGEIRNISKLEARLAEAEKLGFIKATIPASPRLQRGEPDCDVKVKEINLNKVKNLANLIENLTQ